MTSLSRAAELDATDPLAGLRDRFDLPPGVVYLDGNSLGAPLRVVADRVAAVVREQWAGRLIRAWSEHWWDAPVRVGEKIAPLLGAAPGQVLVADSTSVCLFRSLVAGLRMAAAGDRDELAVLGDAFPTDRYLAGSAARLTGCTVTDRVTERTALVLVGHVDYRTGELTDLAAVTAAAHDAGAVLLADLSHSVGAVPITLDADRVDLAVGCTYKFLAGGPGAPAFSYVAARRQADYDQPLPGWTGHADPFAMRPDYTPADGVGRVRSGTPDVLSLLALDAALDIWTEVSVADVRAKGVALTEFFVSCLPDVPVTVLTPDAARRGNQVSLRHPDAAALIEALTARQVIGDFRPPDIARFGFAPLYTRFVDAFAAADALRSLLK